LVFNNIMNTAGTISPIELSQAESQSMGQQPVSPPVVGGGSVTGQNLQLKPQI